MVKPIFKGNNPPKLNPPNLLGSAFKKRAVQSLLYLDFKKYFGVFLACCDLIENQNFSVRLVIM